MNIGAGDIAHLVQLSVAPVFLLTGIGALLSVLTTRMSRIVDRGHVLAKYIDEGANELVHKEEISSLGKRLRNVHRAIMFGTISALIICVVVICIFVSEYFDFKVGKLVAGLFSFALIQLIISLIYFLVEVGESIKSIKLAVKVFDRKN